MVGRGGNSRNWLSPLFMLIHYSMAKYYNIPGHPGYYISRNGKLYTRHIPGNTKGGLYKDRWVLRNRYSLSNGRYVKYYRVEIQGKKWYVHRLVAFVWLPNPENLPCVGHKDNNPLNNRVSNLYWCTQEENMKQMIRDGRSLRGEKNPAWKDRDFEKISQMFAEGKGIIDIAKSLGISRHIVQKSIQLKFKELWQERR